MNNFVYVYSPDRTRLTNPLIILCWRGCVKVRNRDAYELFVRVEPNRDVICSRDIGDCGPVSSMAALPAGSACMMLQNYGDHGRQLFIRTRGALDRVNRLLFRLSGLPPTDSRPGLSFPAMTVFQSAAPRWSWCRTGKRHGFRSSARTATDHREISAALPHSRNQWNPPELNATMKRIHRSNILPNRVIDFFIVGAHKAGTTSLYDHLAQHPQLFLPQIKETRFFHEPAIYQHGPSWLAPLYRSAPETALLGGADVHSLFFPEAAPHLHEYNPRMKLLAVLRNPVDRAYSAYWFGRKNGRERCRTFEEALALEKKRVRGSYIERAELTLLAHGHYAEQLERFYSFFGRSNVLVLLTEDLATDKITGYVGSQRALARSGSECDPDRSEPAQQRVGPSLEVSSSNAF